MFKDMDDRELYMTNHYLLIPTSESSQHQSPLIACSLKYELYCHVSSNFGLYSGHCNDIL